jgi:hypothetical protein
MWFPVALLSIYSYETCAVFGWSILKFPGPITGIRHIGLYYYDLLHWHLRFLFCFVFCNTIDYCNSILYGVPQNNLKCLQSVLNAAARLVSQRRKFDHITDVMRDDLHWLPIYQRVQFKLLTFTMSYKCIHGLMCPLTAGDHDCALQYAGTFRSLVSNLSLGPEVLE